MHRIGLNHYYNGNMKVANEILLEGIEIWNINNINTVNNICIINSEFNTNFNDLKIESNNIEMKNVLIKSKNNNSKIYKSFQCIPPTCTILCL